MATVRRFFVFGAVLATVLLLGTPGVEQLPGTPIAHAAGPENFTQIEPGVIYETDPSHLGVAQANPGLGLNGYCVDVATESAVPILNGESGFTVTDGAVVSHAAFTNSSNTTLDDFYCVVVESALGASSVEVAWNFTDSGGGASGSATLTLDVVVVVLEATNGFVGSPAVVCTLGWDETILTGATSNLLPGAPDPLNQVVAADWTTLPGAPAVEVLGAAFPNGSEWCVNLSATAEQQNVGVTLDFVSVRNRSLDPDDIAHQVATTVDIFADPGFSELRHVTAGGPDPGRATAGPKRPRRDSLRLRAPLGCR